MQYRALKPLHLGKETLYSHKFESIKSVPKYSIKLMHTTRAARRAIFLPAVYFNEKHGKHPVQELYSVILISSGRMGAKL